MTASRPGFTGLDGFVLAGGRAARMGIDKARIPFPGRWPMAVHVAGVVEAACGRVTLVRRGPPDGLPWVTPDGRSLEVVRDADQGVPHPLNGLVTACAASRTPWLVVVPCVLARGGRLPPGGSRHRGGGEQVGGRPAC
ncbi:MAG: NTP transferase domain-containing protein [Deltaproteobacteria bacterium]|nr:NTP transferase domain-containing protein [Deltaproteobacteria bacterium]